MIRISTQKSQESGAVRLVKNIVDHLEDLSGEETQIRKQEEHLYLYCNFID